MSSRLASLIALGSCLLTAVPASANWPAGGKLVSSPGDVNGVRNARIIELPSGDLVVLGVGSAGSTNTYVIQCLDHAGVIASGWPANGVALSPVIKGAPLRTHSVVVDDAARTWHSWCWGNSFAQSIDASATPSPVPGGTSYNLGSGAMVAHAAPAPGGEAFVVVSGSRLKRITAAGTASAGWPSTGKGLPGTSYDDTAILPDGSGGVVVFLRRGTGELPTVIRLDGNGSLHAGWPAFGLALSDAVPAPSDIANDAQLIPADADHMLAVWSLDAGSGKRRLMMQRFDLNGVLDPAWPAESFEAVAADTLYACRAIADGMGGAYVVRQSHGRPVATHVTSAGATQGGANVEFVDPAAQYVPTLVGGVATQGIPDDMIADATPDGGLLVGWNDRRLAPAVSFRFRWLTPSLTTVPATPDTGLVYFPGSAHSYHGALLAAHADGPQGAFIAWSDYHDIGFGQVMGDLWMTRVERPTTVSVGPAPRPVLALSAPRPNPATGSVALDLTLPDDVAVRVELLDIAGRVRRAQSVEGAGDHAITFDELGSLPPGLYFARVTSRHGSPAVRVIVSR